MFFYGCICFSANWLIVWRRKHYNLLILWCRWQDQHSVGYYQTEVFTWQYYRAGLWSTGSTAEPRSPDTFWVGECSLWEDSVQKERCLAYLMTTGDKCDQLLKALQRTHQKHVANFITHNGGLVNHILSLKCTVWFWTNNLCIFQLNLSIALHFANRFLFTQLYRVH